MRQADRLAALVARQRVSIADFWTDEAASSTISLDDLRGAWSVHLRGWAALEEVVASVTYKPGWSVEVKVGAASYAVHAARFAWPSRDPVRLLIVSYDAPDATRADRHVRHQVASLVVPPWPDIYPDIDHARWVRFVFEALLWVERHEAAEFFRVCGEPVYNPHDADAEYGGAADLPSRA